MMIRCPTIGLIAALVILCHTKRVFSKQKFVIGGLFDTSQSVQQTSFVLSAQSFNNASQNIELQPRWRTLNAYDAFQTTGHVCDLLFLGAVAIFGPTQTPGGAQARSVCEEKEIPHFNPDWDFQDQLYTYSISLYPDFRSLGKAVYDLVQYFQWTSFAVLFQTTTDLIQLTDVLQLPNIGSGVAVMIRELDASEDYRQLLKEIKSKSMFNHIIVQADISTSRRIIAQAVELKMFNEYYHYIFTNMDMWTSDLETYVHDNIVCNVTTVRLVKNNTYTQELMKSLNAANAQLLPIVGVPTSLAVMYDSALLLAKVLDHFGKNLKTRPISCETKETWSDGTTALNYLKTTEVEGCTGRIRIGPTNQREGYEYTFLDLGNNGFDELGVWNDENGLTITKNYTTMLKEQYENLENKSLIVTVYLEDPFVMLKESIENLGGNDRFEGYCVDLLEEIAKLRHFKYIIKPVKDKSYGTVDDRGNWNGLVGELTRGEADLAVAALTISYSRSLAIDFTVPYMHLGISILFKKPEKKTPSLFSFLAPLSLDVWIYMIAAYIVVSMVLWVLARFTPYEWVAGSDDEVVENQFTLLNSFWFTVGSLMQQGSEINPRATSTRLIAGIWWFFTLILISSYTANLAAFLTVERMVSPIESADDLAKQTKIKYGTLGRGSTMAFFKESKIGTYEKMWAFMESAQPSVFVNSSDDGIVRVKQEDYAYLMESSMLEYRIERDCELMQINGLLDSKGYGIGLPRGSPYREPISSAILILQENTKLTALKDKWWKQKRGGGKCTGLDETDTSELDLRNVGGVFVLLLVGIAAGFTMGIFEFCYYERKHPQPNQETMGKLMWKALKFSVRCWPNKKPNRKKPISRCVSTPALNYLKDTFVPGDLFNYSFIPNVMDKKNYES